MVRSLSGERRISRTRAIGLRRGPQPPMPTVMPSFSCATTSAALICLSAMASSPLLRDAEVVAPQTHAGELLHGVRAPVDHRAAAAVLDVEVRRRLHVEGSHSIVGVLTQRRAQGHAVLGHAV